MISVVLTLLGACLGAAASWYVSNLFYRRSLEASESANSTLYKLNSNLVRLLVSSGIDPERVLKEEALQVFRTSIEAHLDTDSDGETIWKYCPMCGGGKNTVRCWEPADRHPPNPLTFRGVDRIIDGQNMFAIFKFHPDTTRVVECLQCGYKEAFPLKGVVESLPDEVFASELYRID